MSQGKRILVFGASSAICHELLKIYAKQSAQFFLVGRNMDKLQAVSDDLVARGGSVVGTRGYDFTEVGEHASSVAQASQKMGEIDLVLVAHGAFPEQAASEESSVVLSNCLDENFVSAAVIAQTCAQQLASQQHGTLAVVSSVAGDRGRKSNYSYGAAKAGLDAFLQGLQGRFSGTQVKIVNIKPGMIKSPMTAGMKQGLFWSTPEIIAPQMERAITRGSKVVYVPGYWRLIMLVIRLLPTRVLAALPI